MKRRKVKLKRAAAGLLTLAAVMGIVVLCFMFPGYFLHVEKNRDIGRSMRGENEFYADDVQSGMALELSMAQRLRMLSGQWKCEKTKLGLGPYGEQRNKALQAAGSLVQRLRDFFVIYGEFEADPSVYMDMDNVQIDRMSETRAFDAEYSQTSNPPEVNGMFSEYTLYRIEDKVLNTYDFYVWEIRFWDYTFAMDYRVTIDAVTYDIYRLSVDGDVFDKKSTDQVFDMLQQQYLNTAEAYQGEGVLDTLFVWFQEELPASVYLNYPCFSGLALGLMLEAFMENELSVRDRWDAPEEWCGNGYESSEDMLLWNAQEIDIVYERIAFTADSTEIYMYANFVHGVEMYYGMPEDEGSVSEELFPQ